MFLHCDTDLSNNEKLKIINKTTQKINKKYFDEDFEKVAKLKKAVAESLKNQVWLVLIRWWKKYSIKMLKFKRNIWRKLKKQD